MPKKTPTEVRDVLQVADGTFIILRSWVNERGELHIYLNQPGTEDGLGRVITGYVTTATKRLS